MVGDTARLVLARSVLVLSVHYIYIHIQDFWIKCKLESSTVGCSINSSGASERVAGIAMADNQCWSSGVVLVALLFSLAGAGLVGGASSLLSGVVDATDVPMVTLTHAFHATSEHVTREPAERGPSRRLTTASVWCVAKANVSSDMLQGALDWVCGPGPTQGQVNCLPVQSGNICFQPDTKQMHASWAFNFYFHAHNATNEACDFLGTATQVYADPSTATCVFIGSTKEISGTISNGTMASPSPTFTNFPRMGPGSAAPRDSGSQLLSHLLAAAVVVLVLLMNK